LPSSYALATSVPSVAGSNGYVQFNSSGNLGADGSLYWDNTNKRLGIGTTSPTSNLHLARTETASQDSVAKFLSTQTTNSSDAK